MALGSIGLALGASGIVGGAVLGLVWAIALGSVVERLLLRNQWKRRLANGSVFVVIVASGLMPHALSRAAAPPRFRLG